MHYHILVTIFALSCANLLIVNGIAYAQNDESNQLLELLGQWVDKAVQELSLEDAPSPTRATAAAFDLEQFNGRYEAGYAIQESHLRNRPARIEVVVGDDRIDSSRFRATSFGFGGGLVTRTLRLVIDDDAPVAIERDLWIATDTSYKLAIQQYQAKVASLGQSGEERPADWSAAPIIEDTSSNLPPVLDGSRLGALGRSLSAAVWEQGTFDKAITTAVGHSGIYMLATSEGTRIVQAESYVAVKVTAEITRGDGVLIDDHIEWIATTAEELPDDDVLIAAAKAMADSVLARAHATVVDYYEGPVVFEDNAAADVFRYLAEPELWGTPPMPQSGRSYTEMTRTGPRLGRRLLPPGWSIVDDPQASHDGLPGHYRYDREGVVGKALELVRDGYVQTLAMSRVPRPEISESNGHARGAIQREWMGRLSVWQVSPHRPLPSSRFSKEVSKVMRASGVDRILVVRRLSLGRAGSLPRPTDAVWRFADGHEEPVQLAEFQKVDRRTLRTIVAATGSQTMGYLNPFEPRWSASGDRGLPTIITAPERILIEDIEVAFPGASEEPHLIGPPPRE